MKIEAKHVFKFTLSLNSELEYIEESIYTNIDFMDKEEDGTYWDDSTYAEKMAECEDRVSEIYFDKEKIDAIKQQLCNLIMQTENPFHIYCTDWDGGYTVDEQQLLENQRNIRLR